MNKLKEKLADIIRQNASCYMKDYIKGAPAHEIGVQRITNAILKSFYVIKRFHIKGGKHVR